MDYGTLINNLKEKLIIASNEAYKSTYGSKLYYQTLNLTIHKAFDDFSRSLNIEPNKRGIFRDLLKKHCIEYRIDKSTTGLNTLFYTLPNQYNVRGKWASMALI